MSQATKLKELLTQGVIPDIDERIDEIFQEIADTKDASAEAKEELEELREFKADLEDVLKEIDNGEIDEEECKELIEDILQAQSGYEDEE